MTNHHHPTDHPIVRPDAVFDTSGVDLPVARPAARPVPRTGPVPEQWVSERPAPFTDPVLLRAEPRQPVAVRAPRRRRFPLLVSIVIVILANALLAVTISFGTPPLIAGIAAAALLICGFGLILANALSEHDRRHRS
jgi:hypothetical protein